MFFYQFPMFLIYLDFEYVLEISNPTFLKKKTEIFFFLNVIKSRFQSQRNIWIPITH